VIGVAVAAAAAVAIGGGTYAAFTDSRTGPSGTLSSGTLTLDVRTNPSNTATLLDATNIVPGQTLPPKVLIVENKGSIDGTLTITGTLDTHGGQLQDQLTVAYNCTGDDPAHGPYVASGVALAGLFPITGIPMSAGERVTCNFRFTLPERADNNDVQGDRVTVASTFTLTQA
jgi:predicted ribosomally synthesized peptide with SipW-like signal peptide